MCGIFLNVRCVMPVRRSLAVGVNISCFSGSVAMFALFGWDKADMGYVFCIHCWLAKPEMS